MGIADFIEIVIVAFMIIVFFFEDQSSGIEFLLLSFNSKFVITIRNTEKERIVSSFWKYAGNSL